MNKGTTIFIDTEDMEERYGEELYKEYLEKDNKQLKQENEKLHHYKKLYQSLKRQKEELRSWLVEQEKKSWDEVSSTFGYVLDKVEELEGDSND